MKRLYFFSIRSFAGPFLATFAISMFILIMQFFWLYIDDLLGKGLKVTVIIELLFYVSASLIPLALPLAILLSSIMTFGNLSENNELTALKSSGQSLYKIIRPLLVVVVIIALGTFYFANYVIPVANLKWQSLIFDIQNTKISTIITPGVYSHELDGYVIKVDEGKGNTFQGVLIHDHTTPNEIKTVRAESGKIYKSRNGKYLFFEMKNGSVLEELEPQTPQFNSGKRVVSKYASHSARRSSFDHATYKIDVSGFDLQRSKEDLLKDKHEMLNVFQINTAMDSIQRKGQDIINNFLLSIKGLHPYLAAHSYQKHSIKQLEDKEERERTLQVQDYSIDFEQLESTQQIAAIEKAQAAIRKTKKNLIGQRDFMKSLEKDMDNYMVEFNKKFALTAAILILFFIGAPLGAVVRKGGFGAPVVIAALLFMIYFVLLSIGDNLTKTGTLTPFVGMWFPSMVLAPMAVFLMYSAANDHPVNTREYWIKLIRRVVKSITLNKAQ
ncbi:LptF/LptG family permease [Crocinitomicaceae bacterium]|nr:LptF/LptG family permease [Crocinitomicaceae bacterium]MDG1035651.1 LptF/LptG family permease [Crocinitomicaceae bacterium]